MRIQWIRRLAGGAGLFAAAWLAVGSVDSGYAADPLPPEVTGKLVEADIALLQKKLATKPAKRAEGSLKAVAMMIALYADQNASGKDAEKMIALRSQALKVAEAIAKKDFAAAKTAAEGLSKPSGGDKKAIKLHEQAKFDIAEVMSPFRAATVDGLNIEKDIRAQAKGVTDVKLVGDLAAHTTLLGEYTLLLPVEKATANAANKKKWDDYTNDMLKLSRDIAAEAAKGAKADKAGLKSKLSKLDGSCTACHNDFRD